MWFSPLVLIPCLSVQVQEESVSLKGVVVSQNTDKSPVSTSNAING